MALNIRVLNLDIVDKMTQLQIYLYGLKIPYYTLSIGYFSIQIEVYN